MLLRISARQSDLARLQARMVGQALQEKIPGLEIQFQFRESLGDKNLQDPLWKMPEKGVFTEDFYQDLIQEKTDMVVHSWKDLPTEGKPDTLIAATLPRADQRDLLLMKKNWPQSQKISILSSSPRRAYNLHPFLQDVLPHRPESSEIVFENVRGNIPTRVRKLVESSDHQGLILAKAALDRLLMSSENPNLQEFAEVRGILHGLLQDLQFMVLPLSVNPNAAAQGALALEIKSSRKPLFETLQKINHPQTFKAVQIEREKLKKYGGGCHQKIGVACLPQELGEVLFEQGLTEAGQKLNTAQWLSGRKAPQFLVSEMCAIKPSKEVRQKLVLTPESKTQLKENNLWVARSEAWPDHLTAHQIQSQFVWTAGVQTWKALARKGIWVHGTADGLGDWEQTAEQLNGLASVFPAKAAWCKLTHLEASEQPGSVAIYAAPTVDEDLQVPRQAQFFFWSSGLLFQKALKQHPFLRQRYHASGPGLTSRTLLKELPQTQVFVFYNEADWRLQCQIS